jgi:hypothetical protein
VRRNVAEDGVVTRLILKRLTCPQPIHWAPVLARSVLARRTLRRYLHADKVFPAGSGHWQQYVVIKTRGWLGLKAISVEESSLSSTASGATGTGVDFFIVRFA